MTSWGRCVRLLTAIATGAVLLGPVAGHDPSSPALAAEPETRTIRVSAIDPVKETFHHTAFYPSSQQVRRGDIVEWSFLDSYAGWHTVTFDPADMAVAEHPSPVYPEALMGGRWGQDETGFTKMPQKFVLGSTDGGYGPDRCGRGAVAVLGWPEQQPCVLDGYGTLIGSSMSDTFVAMNTGSNKRFKVEIGPNMPLGAVRYHCLLHPSMVGELEVVGDTEPVDTYTDAEFAADLAADTAAAQALAATFANPADAYDPETGTWEVKVTEATPSGRTVIMDFLPTNLEVRPGDQVRFVAGGSEARSNEPNTVTFPSDAGGSFCIRGSMTTCDRVRVVGIRPLGGTAFVWGCDPDDPDSGLVFTPITWSAARDCPPGQTLEWVLTPYMSHPQEAPGGEVATPASYHSSGVMMPEGAPLALRTRGDGTLFPSTFTARFPTPGDLPYRCIAHPDFMAGSIRVVA